MGDFDGGFAGGDVAGDPAIDYEKIFSGFHVFKSSSSIPVLQLPYFDKNEEFQTGLESSNLDYSEVFGNCDANDFFFSYDKLFLRNSRCPHQMGSLHQELVDDFGDAFHECSQEPFASFCDTSELLETSHDVVSSVINASDMVNNKSSNEDLVDQIKNMPQFNNASESTSLDYARALPRNSICEKSPPVTNDLRPSLLSKGIIDEGEHSKETIVNGPAHVYRNNDLKDCHEQHGCLSSSLKDACEYGQRDIEHSDSGDLKSFGHKSCSTDGFLTVFDISLRTEPSKVPPPSRPPPKLVTKQQSSCKIVAHNDRAHLDELRQLLVTDQNNQSGTATQSNVREEATEERLPSFFDIEIDARSAPLKEAGQRSQQLRCIEASMDQNGNHLKHLLEVRSEDQKIKHVKNEKIAKENQKFISEAWKREEIEIKFFSGNGRPKAPQGASMAADFEEKAEILELIKESVEKAKWSDFGATLFSHKSEESAVDSMIREELHELEKKTSSEAPDNDHYQALSEKKQKVTVHDCEVNVREAENLHRENNDNKKEENVEKIGVSEDTQELEQRGSKLNVTYMAHDWIADKKVTLAHEHEVEEKRHKEDENGSEVLEKASDLEETQNKLMTAQVTCEQLENLSEIHEAMGTIRTVKDAFEYGKSEFHFTETHISLNADGMGCEQDEHIDKLNRDEEIPKYKDNDMYSEVAEEEEHEKKMKVAEEVCDWDLLERNLKDSEVMSKQGQTEVSREFEVGDVKENVWEAQSGPALEDENEVYLEIEWSFSRFETGKKLETTEKQMVPEESGDELRMTQPVGTNQDVGKKEEKVIESHEVQKKENQEQQLESEWVRNMGEIESEELERRKKMASVSCDSAIIETQESEERVVVKEVIAEAQQRALSEVHERMRLAQFITDEDLLAAMPSLELRIEEKDARVRGEDTIIEQASTEKVVTGATEREDLSPSMRCCMSREGQTRESKMEGLVVGGDTGIKQISSFLDSGRDSQIQSADSLNSCSQNCPISSNEEKLQEAESESARRYQARLKRHQRVIERAAKALAEKKFRDILLQREHVERSRLAETLDADLRRWSSGKEGNLRALLSTLQYILGPESGWRPIPLTDVITAVGVKKAYRKAALCVHPDKVQQRCANIQQKYICEKVYDLLKESWHKFNAEVL